MGSPMTPSRIDIEALAKAWISYHHLANGDPAREQHEWAWEQVTNLVDEEPKLAWAAIQDILNRDCSPPIMGMLAAGPVEELLVKHGAEFIDRIENLARSDVRYRSLLGGVWKSEIPVAVWERIEAVRGHVW